MQKVIVTGGAGFIGSMLCKVLAKNSYQVIAVDDLSTGFRELVKYGELIEADCGDYQKMVELFKKHKPIAVFHIAGSKSVAESLKDPFKYYHNNAAKTNLLLKACANCDVKHFIFSSSAAVFGEMKDVEKIDKDYPTNPINPYGQSKLMAEKMIEDFAKRYGMIYSSLRYFNVTGADPEAEMGEMTANITNIFPLILRTIDKKQDEFQIFGDDYKTKDGSCVRDYVHVYDLAQAHLLAFKKQLATGESIKINLGNGTGFSVKEVVEIFKKTTNINFSVKIGERRKGDPDSLIADNNFANHYLNWKPQYTNLANHVDHAWKWHQKIKENEK